MSTISALGTQNSYTMKLGTDQETAQTSTTTASQEDGTQAQSIQDTVSLSAEAKAAKQAFVAQEVERIHAMGAAWEEKLESELKKAYVEPAEKEEQTEKKAETKTEQDAELEVSDYDQQIAEDLLNGETTSTGSNLEAGNSTSDAASVTSTGQSSPHVAKISSAYARMAAGSGSTFNTSA